MEKNKNTTDEKSVEELTDQDVWDILKFAQSMTGSDYLAGAMTPYLMNERMKDITLNPLEATSANIEKALSAPKDNEDQLRGYSEDFELNSMVYKRMINYLSNLLSFDLTYVCTNAEKKDYAKTGYKSDEKKLFEFLDKFNVIKEFKLVMKQLMRQEAFFGILRDDGDKYTIQELPGSRCKIDGRWDYGLLFAFDFYWFNQVGVDIDLYPDAMKRMYNDTFPSGKQEYQPDLPVSMRSLSSFNRWVDCSPSDGFWAWKFTPEVTTRVPYLSALFADLALQPLLRTLKKNSDIISASKLILGEVPFMQKDAKGGVVKDQVSISPDLLGKFLGLIKAGLHESIKVAAAPLKNMTVEDFPQEDKNIYSDYLQTTVAASGINSRLIWSTDKPTVLESQLSVDVDEFLMNYIYPYFENFLEYHINKRTKKFKFKFTFEGSEFSTSREQRLDVQMKFMEKGIVLPQKISAAMGMQYHDFVRHMEMAESSGFVDKLTPIINSSQASKDEEAGRPRKSASDLGEEGSQTRGDGGNVSKGGKV